VPGQLYICTAFRKFDNILNQNVRTGKTKEILAIFAQCPACLIRKIITDSVAKLPCMRFGTRYLRSVAACVCQGQNPGVFWRFFLIPKNPCKAVKVQVKSPIFFFPHPS